MSNVNLDYMLRQAQANVNANKNNAAHQAQVQAQAKAAQERQAYVEEHKNTYKPTQTPVLPTQPKQEPQQDFANLTTQQKLDALMRNGNQKTQPQTQPTKYYTVGAELQHDEIDPHWTTYKPILPYKPTTKLTSEDIATPIKPTVQQKFDDAAYRGLLIADATPKKAIANFETLWNTAGNQLGKGFTLQTQRQQLENAILPTKTTAEPTEQKLPDVKMKTYGELMREQAAENLAEAKEGLGEGGQRAVDLASSLSDMAFGMGTAGALGISSAIPIFAAQSAADGIEEAKANGATEEEAFAYGILKGGLTAVTEKLVSGIPMTGKSLLSSIKPVDDAITKVTAKIAKSPTGAALIKRAFDVLGEGAEEVLETAVTPFLQRMTYDPNADLASKEELLYSAVMGALASAVFNAPGAVGDVINGATQSKAALPTKTPAQTANGEILPRANVQAEAQTAPAMNAQTEAVTDADTDTGTEPGFFGAEVDTESDPSAEAKAHMEEMDAPPKEEVLHSKAWYEETQQAQKAGERLGVKVVITKDLPNGVNGKYENGTIYISENAKNPLKATFVHELTHHLEATNTYGELRAYVLSRDYTGAGDLNAYKAKIRAKYAEKGVNLDDAGIDAEIVAKYVEQNLFNNEKEIARLTNKNRGLAQRIHDWIVDLRTKFSRDPIGKELLRAQRLFEKALRETNVKGYRTSGDGQYSFAGENAETADLAALKRAKKLQTAGADANTILRKTGWFVGRDGKWRFEIDDSSMQYYRGGDATFRRDHPEYVEYQSLMAKMLNGSISADEYARMMELHGTWGGEYQRLSDLIAKGNARLPNIIDHPALFAAYPDLKYVRVGFDALEDGEMAKYNPFSLRLTINEKLKNAPEKTLLHEIQHAIQQIEDFTKGSSPQYWADYLGAEATDKNERTPFDLYWNTSGEIEARDAANRMKLTADERRAQMPDLGDENTVFADGAGTSGQRSIDLGEDTVLIRDNAKRLEAQRKAAGGQASVDLSDPNRDFTTNNGKVGSYLTNAINEESKVIGKALGVPYSRRGDFAKDRLRALANSFMRTGEFDADAALSIFDDAWEQGQLENREYYDAYKDVKDALQKTKVQLTDEVKANIPDFQQWQKYNRFRIGMTNEGGVPIDQKYQELSMQYPNLFPESITDLSEQLMKMAEVSGEIHVAQQSLSEIYGDQTGENYRAMRKSFAERMQDFEKRLKQARDVQVETDAKNASTIEAPTLDFAKQAYQTAKQAKREYEKALARSSVLLTDLQKRQVQAIAAGKLTAEEIPESAAKKTMMELAEIRKRELEAMAPVKAYKEQYRNGLRNTAAKLLEGSYLWKDKSMGLQYSRETMERNVRDMVKDKAQADAIISEYFTPVHKQEAARTRFKNEMRDKVRAMNLNEAESYAVQFLGEKRAEIADLEEQKLDIRKMRKLNEMRSEVNQFLKSNADKIDLPKVERAIEEFHAIYDELFRQMNDVRIKNGYEPVDYRKNYFPHFLDNKPDTLIGKLGAALGIEIDVKELPVDIAGRTHTFRPGIQWFGNTLQRQGTNTGYDAVRGFDKYIEGISNVIYHTDNIQKLRALSNEIRYEGTDAAIQEMIDKIRADENMSDYEKQSRIKDIYEEQPTKLSKFVQELEEYTNILAGKKSRRDRNAEGNIGRKLYSVAQNLNNRVAANMVALNPGSWITNFAPLVQTATQTNPATMARAITDTVKSYAKDDGFANESTFLTNRRGSNPLVVDTLDKLSGTLSKPMEWIDHFTSDAVTRARYYDNMNRGMSHADALDEADSYAAGLIGDRSKGALPTIFEAKNPVTKLFTAFQVEVNNQLSWMFKDLPQDERNKSVAMTAWKLLSLFVGSYLANDVYEKLRGSRVLFDPMSMVNDAVGDITGYQLPNLVDLAQNATKGDVALPFKEMAETEKTGVSNAIGTAAGSAAAELPFIGGLLEGGRLPISSAIPDASQLVKLFDPEVSAEKKWNIAGKELLGKPVAYMAPPFGGGQIKKTVEGLKAVNEGGSYTIDNDGNRTLQYPVFKENDKSDILPYAKAAVFGKSSLPTAKEWVDSGFKTKSVKFTQAYDYLKEQGIKTQDAYDLLNRLQSIEKTDEQSSTELKREMLMADQTLTDAQKSKIDQILIDADKTVSYASEAEQRRSLDTDERKAKINDFVNAGGTVENFYDAVDTFAKIKPTDEQTGTEQKRKWLFDNEDLTPEQKTKLDQLLIDKDKTVSYASEAAQRKSLASDSQQEKIAGYEKIGGSTDEYYRVYDAFANAEGDSKQSAEQRKQNVYNALPTKYKQMVDQTPKDEGIDELKSYLLQSMEGLTTAEKQYLGDTLLGNKITYGTDSEYALSALGKSWVEKYEETADPAGIDADTYTRVYYAYKNATWEKGVDGAKSKAIKAAIDSATGNLTAAQRKTLYEAFGVGKTYW